MLFRCCHAHGTTMHTSLVRASFASNLMVDYAPH
jgi:hypothetical protein